MCEVLQGFRSERDLKATQELLLSFHYHDMGGKIVALQSAGNYRYLRQRGITVRKTIDMLIATFCISHKLQLLHADRNFDAMEEYLGLQVVHPL